MAFMVSNRVFVADAWRATFEQRFRNRLGQIDKQPGFLRMQLLQPVTEGAPYVVQTLWESRDAFQRWVVSEDFRQAHQNPLPSEAYTDKGQLEQHEVLLDSDAVE